MNVDETPLPGIGMRKDMVISDGRRVGVVTHRDGRTELIISRLDDPDACLASIPLSGEEAAALGTLLGGHQIVTQLTEEHRDFEGVNTRQFVVEPGSRFAGHALGDTCMRTKTGASIVAVVRAGRTHASPGPDFILEGGDMLITVGSPEGLDAADKLLNRS
jgi:K+/H+ antiporter YhaU regulatory subunit KhtT